MPDAVDYSTDTGFPPRVAECLKKKREYVKAYLPDERDTLEPPRAWLANVFFSVIGEEFGAWVRDRVDSRNAELKEDRNLEAAVDPDVLGIFRASTGFSGKYPLRVRP